jgi:kinetochore protein Spc25
MQKNLIVNIEEYQKKEQEFTECKSNIFVYKGFYLTNFIVRAAQQKEEDEGREAIESFQAKYDEMVQLNSQLASQIEEVREEIRKTKERQAQERQVLNEQMALVSPELHFWEQTLGLRIEGVQEDVLRFVFTNIDEKDYSRQFSCTLDLSDVDYRIIKCCPELEPEVIESTVKVLNETRRLNLFLKTLRKAFKGIA